MPLRKRTTPKRQADYTKTVELVQKGYTQPMIAKELGLSPAQIAYDWKRIVKQLQVSRISDVGTIIDLKLNELAATKAMCYRFIEMSLKPKRKRIHKVSSFGDKGGEETINQVEKGLPPAAYIQIIVDCVREECKLHGINQDLIVNLNQQINNTQNNTVNVFDFKALLGKSNTPNEVEEKLRKASQGQQALPDKKPSTGEKK